MSTANAVLGVTPIDVTYEDGTKSRFEMKRLRIRDLLRWCDLVIDGDDFDLVCLSTGQPANVVERLSSESFGLLIAKAWEINFPKAAPIIQSSPVLANKMLPVIRAVQKAGLEVLTLIGGSSSQEELLTKSKVESGIESSTSPSATSQTQLQSAESSKLSNASESSTPSTQA